MCLILFAWRARAGLPLVVAANRDEFHARPAAPAARWDDHPGVFGGRDLQDGGTWLAVATGQGRFAAVTNVSEEPPAPAPAKRSRGELTAGFLAGSDDAADFAAAVAARGDAYRGFNLLLGDRGGLCYVTNRGAARTVPRRLEPGVYGLSNHVLDAPWPKVRRGKAALETALDAGASLDALFAVLADRTVAADHELPQRGRDIAVERRTSPAFIVGEAYGTRASTVLVARDGVLTFAEQSFAANGGVNGRVEARLPWRLA
jgi:uncharacterized protein with NRDE domain